MTSTVLKSVLCLGLLAGCGSSGGASGKTSAVTGDGGPGRSGASAGGGSAGGAGKPNSAGGTTGSGGVSGGGNGGQSSGGAANTGGVTGSGGAAGAAGAAGTGTAGGDVSCDPRKILCKRLAPECGTMEVPSVEGSCYGPCAAIGKCTCTAAEECPDSNQYTCNKSAAHCTPYLR
ncbi:MAG TPA: hypothetical protein VF395_04480 [Polyangiaceae bacterium]